MIDKIELDQDLRGVRARVRRSRTFKNPRIFGDWTQAVVYALAELQITDQVREALNAQVQTTAKESGNGVGSAASPGSDSPSAGSD